MSAPGKPQHGRDHRHDQPSGLRREHPVDALVDRYLDGELQPQDSRALFDALDRDRTRARELYAMQAMIQELGEPVRGHDFSKSILARVHGRKPLLERSGMRLVTVGRIAAAVALLASAAGVFTLVRFVPGVQSPGVEQPRDIGNLASALCAEAPAAIGQIQADLAPQVVAPITIASADAGPQAEIEVAIVFAAEPFEGEAFAMTSADVVDTSAPERDPLITCALCSSATMASTEPAPPFLGVEPVGPIFAGMAPSDPLAAMRFGPDGLPLRAAGLGVEDLFIWPSMEGRFVASEHPERGEVVRRGRAKRK